MIKKPTISPTGKRTKLRRTLSAPLNLMIVSNAVLVVMIVVSIYLQSNSLNLLIDRQNNQVVASTHLIEKLVNLEWLRKSLLQSIWTASSSDDLNARLTELNVQNYRIDDLFNQLLDAQFSPIQSLQVQDPHHYRFDDNTLQQLARQNVSLVVRNELAKLGPDKVVDVQEILEIMDGAGLNISQDELERTVITARNTNTVLEMIQMVRADSYQLTELSMQIERMSLSLMANQGKSDLVAQRLLEKSGQLYVSLREYEGVNTQRLGKSLVSMILADSAGKVRVSLHRFKRTTDRVKKQLAGKPSAKEAIHQLDHFYELMVSSSEVLIRILELTDWRAYYSDSFDRKHLYMIKRVDVIESLLTNEQQMSAAVVLESADRFRLLISIFGVSAVLLSIAFGWSTRKAIVSPLMMMSNQASRLAEGDLDNNKSLDRVGKRADEVGVLARTLSRMTRSLSEQKKAIAQQQQALEKLAFYDSLTGLPNRAFFRNQLEQALRFSERSHTKAAIMFIDLDGFKHVNDTLGHDAGDSLLQVVSERLSECLRASDCLGRPHGDHSPETTQHSNHGDNTLARLGGDEFTVVLSHIENLSSVSLVADRIVASLSKPVEVKGQQVITTPSIGIAIYPEDGLNVEEILKRADIAMYKAKHQGKNQYVYFSPELDMERNT